MAAFKKLGKKCWQGCSKEEGTRNYMVGGSANDYNHYGTQGVSPKNNHHMTQLYYSYVYSENYLTTKTLVH